MRHSHAVRVSQPFTDLEAGDRSASVATEAQVGMETHAVSVETIFAGVSISTRLLPAIRETARADASRRFLGAGAVLLALALASFVAASVRAADERCVLAAWTAAGHEASTFVAPLRPAVPLDLVFGLGLLGGTALMAVGLHRRAHDQRRFRRTFTIGSAPTVDAPFDPARLPAGGDPSSHPLVTHSNASRDYLVRPTPSMTGVIEADGRRHTLAEVLEGPGPSPTFRLPPGARARLEQGRTAFVIRSIQRPAPIGHPRPGLNAPELPYTLGAALALGLFVLMIFTIPPDPRSLSLDLLGGDSRLISFNVLPPVVEQPQVLAVGDPAGGAAAPAAKGPRGASGDPSSRERNRRRDDVRRSTPASEDRLTEKESVARASNAGILGVIKNTSKNQAIIDLFAAESGIDDSLASDVFGNLSGTRVGAAYGAGGLTDSGTGSGGGGTGERLRGLGGLTTLGPGRGGTAGAGWDHGAGRLGGRRARAPEIIAGQANVRGSLDKEIVRRIIRQHINEVRFCYEEALRRQPRLAGRVGVQFTIAGTGQVLASVLQNSTLGNASVENCTVAAVRRWQFPQPAGGGVVIVSYPFVFSQPE